MVRSRAPEALLRFFRNHRVKARHIRLKRNRSRFFHLGADGTLHLHEAYASAPDHILVAVAESLRLKKGTARRIAAYRKATRWPGLIKAVNAICAGNPDLIQNKKGEWIRRHTVPCDGTPDQQRFIRRLYRRIAATRFPGVDIPGAIPIRLSNRMKQTYGHVYLVETKGGERVVLEMAINIDLMLAGNEQDLVETVVHEMAHIVAFLEDGDDKHGPTWRKWAERAGCEALACTEDHMRRRPDGQISVRRVPDVRDYIQRVA